MLTQNKKIITFAIITLLIVLIMLGFLGWMIKYLTGGLGTALNYVGSNGGKIQSFNFEGLKKLGIKEINDLFITTSTPASIIPTSTIPTSTNSTSTSASPISH